MMDAVTFRIVMNESIFLLDKRVVFDSTKMTLSHGNEIIRISEAETHLLLAFWHGLYKKRRYYSFCLGKSWRLRLRIKLL